MILHNSDYHSKKTNNLKIKYMKNNEKNFHKNEILCFKLYARRNILKLNHHT